MNPSQVVKDVQVRSPEVLFVDGDRSQQAMTVTLTDEEAFVQFCQRVAFPVVFVEQFTMERSHCPHEEGGVVWPKPDPVDLTTSAPLWPSRRRLGKSFMGLGILEEYLIKRRGEFGGRSRSPPGSGGFVGWNHRGESRIARAHGRTARWGREASFPLPSLDLRFRLAPGVANVGRKRLRSGRLRPGSCGGPTVLTDAPSPLPPRCPLFCPPCP